MADFRLSQSEMAALGDALIAMAEMCEDFQDGALSELITQPYAEDPTLYVVAQDFEQRWHRTRDVLAGNCRALAAHIDTMTGTVRAFDLGLVGKP